MRSRQLQSALAAFAEEAATRLHACVLAGDEVPFELDARSSRARSATPLYCYRPLTGSYVADRFQSLASLPSHAQSASLLAQFDGLDRYLIARDAEPPCATDRACVESALLAFLQDVFEEQTAFELRPERLERALARIDGSSLANPAEITLVATLHGLAIVSQELRLTSGLLLAQPHALDGVPEQSLHAARDSGVCTVATLARPDPRQARAAAPEQPASGSLLVVFSTEHPDVRAALAQGVDVLRDLLCALRLFGDGRIALGPVAWSRVASGPWSALPLHANGHPHGMLLVTPDQEDELRAFCNLVSRRAPREGPLAWALRRFELACERAAEYESLSDHLLVLRALLAGPCEAEPEGTSSGLLAARLSALCATPEHRAALTQRTLSAIALERAVIAGTAVEHAGGLQLVRTLSDNLRALLRDTICGHLPADLVSLADDLLLSGACAGSPDQQPDAPQLAEEMPGDPSQPAEILDVAV